MYGQLEIKKFGSVSSRNQTQISTLNSWMIILGLRRECSLVRVARCGVLT